MSKQQRRESTMANRGRKRSKITRRKWKVSQCDGETLFSFKLKLSCFIRYASWQWRHGGPKSAHCHVLHLDSFPARRRLREMSDCNAALPAAGKKPYQADIGQRCSSESFGANKSLWGNFGPPSGLPWWQALLIHWHTYEMAISSWIQLTRSGCGEINGLCKDFDNLIRGGPGHMFDSVQESR